MKKTNLLTEYMNELLNRLQGVEPEQDNRIYKAYESKELIEVSILNSLKDYIEDVDPEEDDDTTVENFINDNYNNDYVIFGTYQAREEIAKNIHYFSKIQEEANDEFGYDILDIKDPEKALTILYYLTAEAMNLTKYIK